MKIVEFEFEKFKWNLNFESLKIQIKFKNSLKINFHLNFIRIQSQQFS